MTEDFNPKEGVARQKPKIQASNFLPTQSPNLGTWGLLLSSPILMSLAQGTQPGISDFLSIWITLESSK